jgi:hypothetical protein
MTFLIKHRAKQGQFKEERASAAFPLGMHANTPTVLLDDTLGDYDSEPNI